MTRSPRPSMTNSQALGSLLPLGRMCGVLGVRRYQRFRMAKGYYRYLNKPEQYGHSKLTIYSAALVKPGTNSRAPPHERPAVG